MWILLLESRSTFGDNVGIKIKGAKMVTINSPKIQISSKLESFIPRVFLKAQEIVNTPIKKLMDEVRSLDRRFQKQEAMFRQNEAKQLLAFIENFEQNDLGKLLRYAQQYDDDIKKEIESLMEGGHWRELIQRYKKIRFYNNNRQCSEVLNPYLEEWNKVFEEASIQC